MPICRPRIATRITVPTAGWDFEFVITDASSLDTALTATVSAGDYFISGDNQSDDLLLELQTQIESAIDTYRTGPGAGGNITVNHHVYVDIHPTTHKVRFQFGAFTTGSPDTSDVELTWTSTDADLAAALGFDTSADDQSIGASNTSITADWIVSHNWFADEDGLLRSYLVVDRSMTNTLQSRAISGKVKSQQVGTMYENTLDLQLVKRAYMLSDDIAYGAAPTYPYERNQPLECWWKEAQKGVEFRVYENAYLLSARAEDTGTETAETTTTLTDTGKSWDEEPFEWKGGILHRPTFGNGTVNDISQSFYISSHTDTVLTVPNAHPSAKNVGAGSSTYELYRHRYKTYVLDVLGMNSFSPVEVTAIDRYGISIPLRKYVA